MNRTKHSFLALALASSMFLGFSGLAMAWPGGHGGGHNGSGYAATLTPEQMNQVQQLHDEFYEATVPLRQQMIIKTAELKAECMADKPDAKKIEQLSTELGTLRGKMITQRNAFEAKFAAAGLPSHDRGPCGFGGGGCAFGPGEGGYGMHGGGGGMHGGGGMYGGSGRHGGGSGMHGGGHRGNQR